VDHCLGDRPESIYLRLVSVPFERTFPEAKPGAVGVGTQLRGGGAAVIVAYGPIMLNQAWKAAALLARDGLDIAVIDMPWLNRFDPEWLRGLGAWPLVVVLDNHMSDGGLGDNLAGALATQRPNWGGQLLKVGVEGVAACGSNDEVLRHHGLDAESIATRLRDAFDVAASKSAPRPRQRTS
jgi:transketolase